MDPVADTTTSNDVLFALTIKKNKIKKKDLGKPENTTSEKKARVRMEPQLKESDARVGLDVDIRSKEMREVKKPHEELTLRVNVNKF